jgi:glycosyltransferase involved in cell wall biosynthesis
MECGLQRRWRVPGGMMIYLNAEVVSGLGEDTFWTWFKREFPTSSFGVPAKLSDDDILLRYSTLGFLPIPGKQVSLCWELYPEMKRVFGLNQWDAKIEKVMETARYCTYRTVASEYSVPDYSSFGAVDVIPIGVDTDLFRPLEGRDSLRKEYGLPLNKKIGMWIGTMHPMKGYVELLKYASLHPDVFWIVVWKWEQEAGRMQNAMNFVQLEQKKIVELVNASDFFLFTSMLKPFYMTEWEVMACDVPIVDLGREREYTITGSPREMVFRLGWDRAEVKKKWEQFFARRGVKW